MANFFKLGAMAWCLTVIGWLVSPIITLLVNKLFPYLVFDASRKLRELKIHTVPSLKLTLSVFKEQKILRAADDKRSQSDLEILERMTKDLKSALYEAEDILDLLDYHQTEKDLIGGSSNNNWVQHLLGTAGALIASCGVCSWFGRWIDITQRAVLLPCARRLYRLERLIIREWHSKLDMVRSTNFRRFDLVSTMHRTLDMVLQCTKSLYQHLKQLFTGGILRRSGPLLPVSNGTSIFGVWRLRGWSADLVFNITSCFGSVTHATEPPRSPAEEVAQQDKEGEEEEGEADEKTGELVDGEEIICRRIRHCCQSILIWSTNAFAAACYYRNWSYEAAGIKIDEMDYSFLSISDRISLKKRIEHINYTDSDSKKSHLFNQQMIQNSKIPIEERSMEQKGIDVLYRNKKQTVFGRENHCRDICEMLHRGPNADAAPYSVIGIYGITGSGKSTLAQYVCDHEKEAGYFNPVMFIQASTFSLHNTFQDMLRVIEQGKKKKKSNSKDIKSLEEELMEELKGRRFLLVLDDLWVNDENEKELAILLNALNAAKSGSRILVTAQTKDAAAALGAQKQILIPDLEDRDYLSLFMHHALPGALDVDGKYERIGAKIAQKLHRSPIAAVAVAKRLRTDRRIEFWETTANLDVLSKTMGALWWSYQQLGPDTRRCFEYCSTFPRGYKLKQDDLVHIWIAQGFVKTGNKERKDMEDLGQSYINELLTFSFLQVQRTNFDTEVVTIHDLLHELAETVAGNDFFRIDSKGSPKDILPEVSHLFVKTDYSAEMTKKILNLENLRTLIIEEEYNADTYKLFCGELDIEMRHDVMKEKVFESLFMRLKKLRVLIIKVQHYHRLVFSVPESIDQMKHLRYFSFQFVKEKPLSRRFSTAPILELIFPSTLSKLYQMQVLDTPRFSCAEGIANLVRLRHCSSSSLDFPNIGRLQSLQTLPCFTVKTEHGYEVKQLMNLNNLRGSLIIKGLENVGSEEEASEAHLSSKTQLTNLALNFGRDNWYAGYQEEVLEGLCPPKELVNLNIYFYRGSTYPSWMLTCKNPDTPEHLHKLTLFECSRLASIPNDGGLLIGLRSLYIDSCDSWDSLPDNMERLVSLKYLCISQCHKIKLLPKLPKCLERIDINHNDMLSSTCQTRGHRNWQNIQHIRTRSFYPW